MSQHDEFHAYTYCPRGMGDRAEHEAACLVHVCEDATTLHCMDIVQATRMMAASADE